jgi:hypothetical protein
MNTSHSVQKSFEQSVHLYRPRGLTPSVPVSIAAPPVPSVEFESELPFLLEVDPLAIPTAEVFPLPDPEYAVVWNALAHA